MHFLESVYIGSDSNLQDFRFPVQLVLRPDLDFRGFSGTVASGIVRTGDEIIVMPSGKKSSVARIVTVQGDLDEAFVGQSITITLADEIDCSRGDMIVRPGNVPQTKQQVDAMLVWMSEQPMVPGKEYLVKQTTKMATGNISTLRYRVDVNTLHRQDAPTLELNEIGRVALSMTEPLIFDSYKKNHATGSFILVDRLSNITVAAGMILDRESDDTKDDLWSQESTQQEELGSVGADERVARFGQQAVTLLITGLTNSGKTTLAYALERRLFNQGRTCVVLDGVNMRRGLSKDLGFSADERSENLRRSAEVACLMNAAGLICISAFVAPNEEVRKKAAQKVGVERFITIHLSTPVEVCRERDENGMYAKADAGEISNFPGVTSEYEIPTAADLTLDTTDVKVEHCVDTIIELLESRGIY
jgi:bifunctional enzyme CysN/CysC